MKKIVIHLNQLIVLFCLLGLLGCGGSGNNASGGLNADGGIDWAVNVFKDENQFKNFCETPRTGLDQFTNNPFPDIAGSTLQENHWLRSWSDNTYLWYNEIVDNNPASFSNTEDYFDQLKTQQTTNSGQPTDKFHFTIATQEWQLRTQSGISAGYGLRWQIIQPAPPRLAVVAFTEPGTPATQANILRGAEVVEVDGIDFVNAGSQSDVDIINAAFFPSIVGESHTFVIRNIGAGLSTVTMTSAEIVSSPVQNVTTFDTNSGKVGYMLFTTHIATAESQLIDAFNQLGAENVNDLILDLRYNGGGLLAIASQVAYMIAGATPTANRTFDDIVFNDKHTVTNPVTGSALSPTPFFDTSLGFSVNEGQVLPSLNLSRVFILSTSGTCSASEAIINGLRGVDVEVILIGATTCGKPYGFFPADNCGTTYFTIQFKGENDKGFGDYTDGFSPANTAATVGEIVTGCSVADDFTKALGDINESLVASALNYRANGTCPTPTAKGVQLGGNKTTVQAAIRVISPIERSIVLEHRLRNKNF